ncbi:hypothetical protein OSB04_024029 [Centaurea solstitialis]|uniref:Uncharacterized protein n=1 Tax=Centaurea solstitialis TaxID=347529 RepID=A0AA38W2S4_9ASTR|nr:hypothetical protein OSB04_024029 [Centaurea solstitialis]
MVVEEVESTDGECDDHFESHMLDNTTARVSESTKGSDDFGKMPVIDLRDTKTSSSYAAAMGSSPNQLNWNFSRHRIRRLE